MRDRWRRAFRSLLFGVMLAACGGQLAACGDQPPPSLGDTPQGPGGPGGAGCATPGSAGCPCAQAGQTAACGKIVDQSGSYVTCSMGTATCDGQAWGPCIGNRIVQKSVAGRSLASGSIRIESATSACSNVCDPNPSCTAIAGGPADVDAGGVAIANGGITLAGSDAAAGTGDGGQCSGNTCKIVACGGDGGTTTTIKGVVYDPAGVNPLYNATVYVPTSVSGKLPAFSSGASCDQCAGASIYAAALTTTATDGSFTLTNAPSGTNIPIVVQMGKWRRELLLSQVTACAANSVTGNCTAADPTMCTLRLPRNKYDGYNALDGQYDHADIPQMALVTGSADPLECMLLKAGIDPSEFSSYDVNPSARIHFYASPDAPGTTLDSHYGHNVAGDVLWLDPGDPTPSAPTSPHYDFYDVVLLPCEGASIDKEPLYTVNGGGEPYKNLIKYTDVGGRVFTTHFGYVWMEYPSLFNYVPAPDNWSSVATWASRQGTTYTQDPLAATIVQTFPKGAAFAQWLQSVGASSTLGQLTLHQARQDLTTVGAGSQAWMTATDNSPPSGFTGSFDPHFTFNTPYGAASTNQCGRVVYSDFHVSASALVGYSSNQCLSNSDCGFTQTCVGGSTGGTGTCKEPCASSADCADGTYSCVGATGGTCQSTACTGTSGWQCSNGGVCNAAHTGCLCTADSQCPSGQCVNSQNQCARGACSGSGATDAYSCVPGSSSTGLPATCTGTPNYSCSKGNCDTVASSSGTCTAGGTPCWCTSNSQCPSGQCKSWSGCGRRACTTTSAAVDAFNCVPTSPGLPATPTQSTVYSCSLGAPNAAGTACLCTADSQCSSGKCVNAGQCTGTCTGSGSADAASCQIATSSVTGYTCPVGGCNSATGACSASGQGCYCTRDSQCSSGKCIKITGQNDLSCGSGTTTCSGAFGAAHDGFDCALASPGIPSTPSQSGTTYTCSGSSTCVGNASCYCDADSFCPSGKCVKTTGKNDVACGASGCTGTGTPDFQGCQPPATLASSCTSNSTCGSSPFGHCSSNVCYCTDDSMCDSGHCVVVAGKNDSNDGSGTRYCGGTNNGVTTKCTGTGTPDSHGCQTAPASVACTATPTYSCAVGAPNATHTACLCTADGQCSSGKCVNAGQCTGTCTGSGTADAASCQVLTDTAATFACATGDCDNVTSPGAACGASGTPCWCTADAQCTSRKCVSWSGCAAGACTGSGTADGMHCAMASPGIPAAPTSATVYSCSIGVSNSAHTACICTADSQCSSGQCVPTQSQCAAPSCTGAGAADASSCALLVSTQTSTTYSCATGTCDATGTNCQCTSDSQCPSGQCINQGQCTRSRNCTGSGTADASSCVPATPGTCTQTTTYSCATGTCNAAHTACLCTSDSQCASGQCVNSGQCTRSRNCTGSGTPDASGCVPSNKTACFSNADCGSIGSCGGTTTPALGTCSKACTSSAQCTGGETCVGGLCQGCSTSAQCTDNTYPATCSGGSTPTYGTCCYPKNPPNPAIPPNQPNAPDPNNCGYDSRHFPQACIQRPLSAQEKALEFMFFDLTACVTPDTAPPPPPSLKLAAQTFPLDFTGTCPTGTKVQWRELDWQAIFPRPVNGSSIAFAAQTGPVGADAAGMLPAMPLPLVTTSTSTALPNFDVVLLDTSPGGTGVFTTATPPLQSQALLRIWVTMNPTADAMASPTLVSWQVQYDCPPSE